MEQKKKNWDQLKRWKTQKDTLKSKEENLHPTSVVRKIKTLANKISAVLQLVSQCPSWKDLEGLGGGFGVSLSRGTEFIPC